MNHFEGTKALTTKVGLTHNMKNLVWDKNGNQDIDAFFPQSYDLSDLKGDELKDFQEDFRFCQVLAFLKSALEQPKSALGKVLEKVMVALSICEKRLTTNSEDVFWNKDIHQSPEFFKAISEDTHAAFVEFKAPSSFASQPWFRKLHNQYKDILTEDTAKKLIKEMLEGRIKELLGN